MRKSLDEKRVYPVTKMRKLYLASLGFDPDEVSIWFIRLSDLRQNAKRRGLVCDLSFEDYINLAKDAGLSRADQVGNRKGCFQLGRIGDVGNYTAANCRFITLRQNIDEKMINGGCASQALKLSKSYEVKSPEGVLYKGINLTAFCREHRLGQGSMSSLCLGRIKQYKGWTGEYIAN